MLATLVVIDVKQVQR